MSETLSVLQSKHERSRCGTSAVIHPEKESVTCLFQQFRMSIKSCRD